MEDYEFVICVPRRRRGAASKVLPRLLLEQPSSPRNHTMTIRKLSVVAALAAMLLAPAISMADSAWVVANNQGYQYQPDHGSSVVGAQGRSAGTSTEPGVFLREGPPLDTTLAAVAGKTREQVRNELLDMSAAEKQRMQEFNRN